jgi:hypothetical protein
VSQQVIHLDFISLSPATSPEDRKQLINAAAKLSALPQVVSLGVIESDAGPRPDFDLVFYFLLPDFASLEPFGTDRRYIEFLQGNIAPRLKAFAGADVRLEDDFEAVGPLGACLALMAPEETYDWEVRDALRAWGDAVAAGAAVVGLAIGEKQMYRGVAIAFADSLKAAEKPEASQFRTTLVSGTARMLA